MKVVVVGGGPVGRYAAIVARLGGMDVTVIEQRGGSIDKACGEGLMPAALGALRQVGVDPEGVPFLGNQVSRRTGSKASACLAVRRSWSGCSKNNTHERTS